MTEQIIRAVLRIVVAWGSTLNLCTRVTSKSRERWWELFRFGAPCSTSDLEDRARGVGKCGSVGLHSESLTEQIVREVLRNPHTLEVTNSFKMENGTFLDISLTRKQIAN